MCHVIGSDTSTATCNVRKGYIVLQKALRIMSGVPVTHLKTIQLFGGIATVNIVNFLSLVFPNYTSRGGAVNIRTIVICFVYVLDKACYSSVSCHKLDCTMLSYIYFPADIMIQSSMSLLSACLISSHSH